MAIFGATGYLGTALSRRMLARGYRIGATYLRPSEAAEYEDLLPFEEDLLVLRRIDATDATEVKDFLSRMFERFGRIDAVAALVGGWAAGRDIKQTDNVRLEWMLDVNLRSAFYTIRAAIPYLEEAGGGRILTIGSRAVVDNPPGQAAFNIAKAGVLALTKTAAAELESSGITVNILLPSVIDTPATRKAMPYAEYLNWPTPDEIAAVAEFILAGDSGVMSGAVVPVYGRA